MEFAWYAPDGDRDPDVAGAPRPVFGTWHFFRASLLRSWRLWVSIAVLGGLMGLAALVLMPARSTATASVLLARPPGADPVSAMATDTSLLGTRTVAQKVIDRLGLVESPEAFQATMTAEPESAEILRIDVNGNDDRAALARAEVLVDEYLTFRAAQLRSLTDGLVARYETRIAAMNGQVKALTAEYGALSSQGKAGSSRASEILSERTSINSQISDAQRAIEVATLQTDAVITASHIIDRPHPVRHSAKRAAALNVGSGLIVGTTLGLGLVLFRALTSERLWRRQEVAIALKAPIHVGVPSTGQEIPAWRRPWRRSAAKAPRHRRTSLWHHDDLEKLVHGLESAIIPPTGWSPTATSTTSSRHQTQKSIAVAALDNEPAGAALIEALQARLETLGRSVFVVDLSASGVLAQRSEAGIVRTRQMAAQVYRPRRAPGLARGPVDTSPHAIIDLPRTGALRSAWDGADVVVALVHVDPDLVVTNLRTWVHQVVPLVTAGRNDAEYLETVSEIIRASGLDLPFAMMLGTDPRDTSLGVPEQRRLEEHERAQDPVRGTGQDGAGRRLDLTGEDNP
jgi:hypothetical protein